MLSEAKNAKLKFRKFSTLQKCKIKMQQKISLHSVLITISHLLQTLSFLLYYLILILFP